MRFVGLALLVACAPSEGATDADVRFALDAAPACPVDVVGLEGGLHAHLLASADGGHTFDYAPDRPLEARVQGSYDLVGGAFAWTRTFAAPYWRAEERVQGEGTAWPSGDLDVAYERRYDRRAGGFAVREVRVQRTGCDEVRVERSPAGDVMLVEHGTWAKRGYAYTQDVERDGAPVTIEGLRRWDRTATAHEAWRVGDHELVADTVDDGRGRVEVTFREVVDGALREGTVVTKVDGGERHAFLETATGYTADWDWHMDDAGNGSGTLAVHPTVGGGYACTITVTDGDCRVQCPDQDAFRC